MLVRVEVHGVQEAQLHMMSKLTEFARAVEDAVHYSCFDLTQQAASNAPIDTGKLEGSMVFSVFRSKRAAIVGRVRMGRRLKYARLVEFGTISNKLRKLPPVKPGSSLHGWATRKGLNPWAVAVVIGGGFWKQTKAGAVHTESVTWRNRRLRSGEKAAGTRRRQSAGAQAHPFAYKAFGEVGPKAVNHFNSAALKVYG